MKNTTRAAFITAFSLISTVAGAAITGAALQAAKAPQADVREHVTENDNGIRGMDEAQTVIFTGTPDYGVPLNNNVWVDCHLLHFDPVNDPVQVTGRFRFDGEIIGVVTESATLDTFDSLCDDGGGGMIYPAPGVETLRGLEAGSADAFQVSQGPGGRWNRIEVTADVDGYHDQVRVITCRDAAIACADIADSIGWDQNVLD